MRQVNFVIIFIFCLAFALFTIENTEPGVIRVVPGLEVQAPIAVELLLAMGLGAVLAWLFSIWTHWQGLLLTGKQVRQKNAQIKELQNEVQQYQAEVQTLKLALPPANESLTKEAQAVAQ
jgi:conjugal transfer/entry exclusion protein